MKYKKGFIFICLIICLFSIASVCASDVNEIEVVSDIQSDDLAQQRAKYEFYRRCKEHRPIKYDRKSLFDNHCVTTLV